MEDFLDISARPGSKKVSSLDEENFMVTGITMTLEVANVGVEVKVLCVIMLVLGAAVVVCITVDKGSIDWWLVLMSLSNVNIEISAGDIVSPPVVNEVLMASPKKDTTFEEEVCLLCRTLVTKNAEPVIAVFNKSDK